MLFKTKGIVLRFTRYGETSIIVNIFTSEFGLQSYIINGARSKSGKGKIALYQPLTLLDLVVYHKESGNIMRIKEAKCLQPYSSIGIDVHKTTIAMFIEELLNKCVREEAHADELCQFLIDSMIALDRSSKPENFHLVFMVKLSRYLGFQPQSFLEVLGGRVMEVDEERTLQQILTADFNTTITVPSGQRRIILDSLIRFYTTHIENFGEMRSTPILRELLH